MLRSELVQHCKPGGVMAHAECEPGAVTLRNELAQQCKPNGVMASLEMSWCSKANWCGNGSRLDIDLYNNASLVQ